MPTFKQVADRPWNRAVKVTVTALALDGVDVQELAQKDLACSYEEDRRGARNREGRGLRPWLMNGTGS